MPFYSFLCINKLRPIFGRVGAGLPAVTDTYDMVDQLLISLHPNLGILSRKKSPNLSKHPHVLWKQRQREPSSSFAPLAAKMKCYLGIQETHKEVYVVYPSTVAQVSFMVQ